MSIYQIGPGRYAIGQKYDQAWAVVERANGTGAGRPVYRGVRGRRPVLGVGHKYIRKPSNDLRRALRRAARFN